MKGHRAAPGVVALSLAWLLGAPVCASAQAWLPPKGEMSISLGYSYSFADEHLDYQGNVVRIPYRGNVLGMGTMAWNDADWALSYGISDRVALRVGVPFVVSRYEGVFPHAGLPGHANVDDGGWHGTFQDLRTEIRFRATKGSLVVTPLAAVTFPTHHYEYFAHSAAGRDLWEAQFGVNAGRLLDPWLPNAYVQARYAFAVPEKVLGIWHNRSNLTFEGGYSATSALTLSVIGDWEKTHGGWRAPLDFPADANILYHDQLARSDYLRLGGGASYALTGSIDIALSAFATVYAHSETNMSGFSLGITYSFSPAQALKRKKASRHAS